MVENLSKRKLSGSVPEILLLLFMPPAKRQRNGGLYEEKKKQKTIIVTVDISSYGRFHESVATA